MLDRVSLKQSAKDKLKGKWGTGVLITFIYLLVVGSLGGLSGIKYAGAIFSIISIFITPPFALGLTMTFIIFVKTESLLLDNLFNGFKDYAKSMAIYWWMVLWTVLWMLLFIVPGIIKALSYSQALFIIADNPNVKTRDALKISIKMTDGYKGDIFVMGLSFIGWALLAILTLGIGMLWLTPYIQTTYTNMFFKLKEMSIQSGKCSEEMFNGTATPVK
jgi:uncharacterized membrane protein